MVMVIKIKLHGYMRASESSKKHVAGCTFFAKRCAYYINIHNFGELYMRFVKDACK